MHFNQVCFLQIKKKRKLVPLDYTKEEMASTASNFKMPETPEEIRKFPIPWNLVHCCMLLLGFLLDDSSGISGITGSRVSCC